MYVTAGATCGCSEQVTAQGPEEVTTGGAPYVRASAGATDVVTGGATSGGGKCVISGAPYATAGVDSTMWCLAHVSKLVQQEERPLTSQMVVPVSWQCNSIRDSGCRGTRLGLTHVGRSPQPGCRSNRGYRAEFTAPTPISLAQPRICRSWGSKIELTTAVAPSHKP